MHKERWERKPRVVAVPNHLRSVHVCAWLVVRVERYHARAVVLELRKSGQAVRNASSNMTYGLCCWATVRLSSYGLDAYC